MMSITNYAEAKILDAVYNNISFAVAATYVKLHIGNPGEDATGSPAAHTTRVAASWGAAVGGLLTNDAPVLFTSMAANETISHISIWDAAAAGNPLWYGALSVARAVILGDSFNFASGAITVTLD